MKKLLIITALLFIIGCNVTGKYIVDECQFITDANEKDECYVSLAEETVNIKYCGKMEDPRTGFYCLQKIGVMTDDLKICEGIEGKDDYWADICYWKIAEQRPDFELCLRIKHQGDKETCLGNIALATKDYNPCTKMLNTTNAINCYQKVAIEAKDETICGFMTQQLSKDICIRKVAIAKEDIKTCEKITTKIVKESCKETINENN